MNAVIYEKEGTSYLLSKLLICLFSLLLSVLFQCCVADCLLLCLCRPLFPFHDLVPRVKWDASRMQSYTNLSRRKRISFFFFFFHRTWWTCCTCSNEGTRTLSSGMQYHWEISSLLSSDFSSLLFFFFLFVLSFLASLSSFWSPFLRLFVFSSSFSCRRLFSFLSSCLVGLLFSTLSFPLILLFLASLCLSLYALLAFSQKQGGSSCMNNQLFTHCETGRCMMTSGAMIFISLSLFLLARSPLSPSFFLSFHPLFLFFFLLKTRGIILHEQQRSNVKRKEAKC